MPELTDQLSIREKLLSANDLIEKKQASAQSKEVKIQEEGQLRVRESVRFLETIAAGGEGLDHLRNKLEHGFFFDTNQDGKTFAIFCESEEEEEIYQVWFKQAEAHGQPSSEVSIYLIKDKTPFAEYEEVVPYAWSGGKNESKRDKNTKSVFIIDSQGKLTNQDEKRGVKAEAKSAYALINSLSQGLGFNPPEQMADKMMDAMLMQLEK